MFRITFFLFLMLAAMTSAAWSQDSNDLNKLVRELRLLDQAAAKAVLERDEKSIDVYFAPNALTNNPRGGLTHGNEGVKALFKTGVIEYASFERSIEHVEIHGNTAVVMGNETLTMADKSGKAGESVKRRYTNVWMKNGGRWQIVARHASVVCN